MINFHCTSGSLNSVITHTSAWFLDRGIHQLVSLEQEQLFQRRFEEKYNLPDPVISSG